MPGNRQNHTNSVSNSPNGPIDNVQEGIWRMKIENGNCNGKCDEKGEGSDGDDDSAPPYPDRPGEPDCIYYLRTGFCGYGSKCRFNHPSHLTKSVENKVELPQRAGQPNCGFYLKTGTCKYGSSCKFHHPSDRSTAVQAPLNSLGLPIRQDSKHCPYYMRTYNCKFGVECKFSHPQPSSAETISPVPAAASAYGAMNSSVYPSVAMPCSSGLSAWLLPRSPYLLGPRLPCPPTYAPIVIPSSQGLMTAQGWSTYVGTVPPTNIYGASFYNTKNQEGFGMNVPLNSSGKISGLPERPEQPECRYFVSTGSCKYGSDCKYNHPKERIAQLSMYSVGPHGLPLRPGEAVCSHFRVYGVCRYGLTCKFDHPVTGYVSSYGFNLQQASLSMLDQPIVPSQRNSSNNTYSESSPSKSSKISDWIQKPEAVDNDNDYQDGAKSPEDAKLSANNPPHKPTASDVPSDQ